jgi:hypothetical protein
VFRADVDGERPSGVIREGDVVISTYRDTTDHYRRQHKITTTDRSLGEQTTGLSTCWTFSFLSVIAVLPVENVHLTFSTDASLAGVAAKPRPCSAYQEDPSRFLNRSNRQGGKIMSTSAETDPDRDVGRRIFLNGFDMFTVGHQSFGQWRRDGDRSADKRRDLSYWTDLAKLLERGDFNALFLADTYGVYDTYKGSAEPAVRAGAQFPMGDPVIVRLAWLVFYMFQV